MQRDMDTLMLERLNKVETHLLFRAARGLCNTHAWQIMTAKGGSLGIAVMYESTIFELLKHVEQIKPTGGSMFRRKSAGANAADKLEATGNCLLCDSMNKTENSYVTIVAENIHDEQLVAALEASTGGVCLPHVRRVLRKLQASASAQQFLTMQVKKWRALQADIELFIQQNEDNVPQQAMGNEGDSWQRAIRYLSGDKEIFGYGR